eukprot:6509337-Pyramimonas_sp.AAC.1
MARTSRAQRTQTTLTGQNYYDAADLVDYHRPAAAKDDCGGLNGPLPVVRNDLDRGQIIMRVGNRKAVIVHWGSDHSSDWLGHRSATD